MARASSRTKSSGQASLKLGHFVLEFTAPAIAYILRNAGFDYAVFDMEHSGKGFSDLAYPVALSRALGLDAIVRIPSNKPDYISRALDIGASGVLVPMVESREQAEAAVAAARYAPAGKRGVALQIAHDEYRSGDVTEQLRRANSTTAVLLQIESSLGVETAEAIADVSGVDCVWIGHFDLSVSQGIPAQFSHSRFTEAVQKVEKVCRDRNLALGRVGGDIDECVALARRGYRYVASSGDVWAFQAALTSAASGIRTQLEAERLTIDVRRS